MACTLNLLDAALFYFTIAQPRRSSNKKNLIARIEYFKFKEMLKFLQNKGWTVYN